MRKAEPPVSGGGDIRIKGGLPVVVARGNGD